MVSKKVRELHERAIVALAFLRDGRLVAGSWDGSVTLRAPSGEVIARFTEAKDRVEGVAVSPDGRHAAAIARDGQVRVYDLDERRLLATHRSAKAFQPAVTFVDAETIAASKAKGEVLLWRWRGEGERVIRLPTKDNVSGLAASPDGTRLAIGLYDRASVWRLDGREPALESKLAVGDGLETFVAFSPDGKTVFAANHDRLAAFDAETGRRSPARYRVGYSSYQAVDVSADGRLVAAGIDCIGDDEAIDEEASDGELACVWDVASGERLASARFTERVSAVAFHPEGKRLAVGLWEPTLHWVYLTATKPSRPAPVDPETTAAMAELRAVGWLAGLPLSVVSTAERSIAKSFAKRGGSLRDALAVVFLDVECIYSGEAYTGLLQEFADASGGAFAPHGIEERRDRKAGRVFLAFHLGERRYEVSLEYAGDWADLEFVETINQALADAGHPFAFVDTGGDYGQGAAFFLTTPAAIVEAREAGILRRGWRPGAKAKPAKRKPAKKVAQKKAAKKKVAKKKAKTVAKRKKAAATKKAATRKTAKKKVAKKKKAAKKRSPTRAAAKKKAAVRKVAKRRR